MKKSLTTELTVIIAIGLITMGILLSGIFIYEMRINSNKEIERFITGTTSLLQVQVNARLDEYSKFLDHAAIGALPLMKQAKANTRESREALQAYYRAMQETHPDLAMVFGCSAGKWNEPGGFMVYSSGYSPAPDYDNTKRSWYVTATNASGQNIFTNPYIDTQSKKLVISMVKAIYDNKEMAGVLGIDISLNALDEMANAKSSMQEIVSYILHPTGKYISNPDVSLIMEKDFFEDYAMNEYKEKIMSAKSFLGRNKEDIISSMPIPSAGWTIISLIPIAAVYKDVNHITFITVLVMIAGVVIFIALFILIVNRKINPIRVVSDFMEKVSATGEIVVREKDSRVIDKYAQRKDEIGMMIRSFNKLISTLRSLIGEAKATVDRLASVSEELSVVSRQLASGSEDTVTKSNTVAGTTEQMSVNIKAMASGAGQASVNANEVAGAAEQMSVNINTIASAVEEMSASISQIAGNTSEVRMVATKATSKAEDATGAMNKLGMAAKEISHVTDIIKKIADKTNLLALNATIEAASAGEAGKGFAVVAGEIKELANQSAQSADDIARRIEGIQAGTSDAVTVISDVSDIIVKINQSVEAIAGHVERQTKTSHDIANNVSQANTGAKRVAGSIGEVARGVNDVSNNASEAAKGAENVNYNVVGMNQAAMESSRGASQVSQSASELSQMAGQLKLAMDKFKI
jgi:methyl-accepting chemotaxis protein